MNSEKQTSSLLNKIKISSRITLFNVMLFLLIGTVNFAIITYSLRMYLDENARHELNSRTLDTYINIDDASALPNITSTYLSVKVGAVPTNIFTDSGHNLQLSARGGKLVCDMSKIDPKNLNLSGDFFYPDNAESTAIELNIRQNIDENSSPDSISGTSLKYYAIKIYPQQGGALNSEHGYLVSFFDSYQNDAIQNQVLELLVFVFFVGAGTLLIFSNVLAKTSLEPLTKLSDEAMAIDFRKPEKRLNTPASKDEISTLTTSLNTMLDNIENSYQRSKRFTQDASHELRIPLTIILGNLELIEKFGADSEIFPESFDAIKTEATGMKQMIERLLTIARMERDDFKPEFCRTHIRDTLASLISSSYTANGREIELDAADIAIDTDPGLLMQLLRAILDNALKYSSDKIAISARAQSDFVTIKIKDSGNGIPKSDIENIKNRFYRTDASRNSKTGGIGLGLSIAELIANSLGGKIEIESEQGVGTEVSVILPYFPL